MNATLAPVVLAALLGAPPTAPPVAVDGCGFTVTLSPPRIGGTRIDYRVTGAQTLHHIVFRVGYRENGVQETVTVQDDGTFTPGARISHVFDAFQGYTANGELTGCTAEGAT